MPQTAKNPPILYRDIYFFDINSYPLKYKNSMINLLKTC